MEIADIQSLHHLVWSYRDCLSSLWPTPNREDSLAFAFTEIGEAIDARLRQNPVYNRNHDKNTNVDDELADCLIMLLTAMGRKFIYDAPDIGWVLKPGFLGDIVFAVAMAYYKGANNAWICAAIGSIVNEWAWKTDPVTVVTDRLSRIRARVTCAK